MVRGTGEMAPSHQIWAQILIRAWEGLPTTPHLTPGPKTLYLLSAQVRNMEQGTEHLTVGLEGQPPLRVGNKLPHSRCVPTTAVNTMWLGRSVATPSNMADTREDLPAFQHWGLLSPAPQIWPVPEYLSSHTSLLYFITHVDFKSVISWCVTFNT